MISGGDIDPKVRAKQLIAVNLLIHQAHQEGVCNEILLEQATREGISEEEMALGVDAKRYFLYKIICPDLNRQQIVGQFRQLVRANPIGAQISGMASTAKSFESGNITGWPRIPGLVCPSKK